MPINIRFIVKIIINKMKFNRIEPTIDNGGPYAPIDSK